jgi:transposase InsO family protein
VDEGQSAHALAKQLGVPYTTAVGWVKRYRSGGAAALHEARPRAASPRERRADPRHAAILATKAAQPTAGSRRIRDVVKRFFGLGVSATTVRRVLAKSDAAPVPKPKAKRQRKPKAVRFERAEPNQLWQSDLFTFLLRKHERVYVAAFLDDHSRYLVSLSMAHHQKSSLVLEALSRGIADYGAPREILTDQGRQYTAWRGSTEFEAELKRHGISHVKSRPHHPQTCGKIERFWKTLWEELLSRTVFADFDDCQRRVALFVQHYNFQRPHQALDGQTPADRFFRSAAPVRAAIEATVKENALRLAREQTPRPPFYLVGRLGDRDLTISAKGAGLAVRVGDEETTIALSKEQDDEDGTRVARWNGGREAQEAAVPAGAEVADDVDAAGRDRAQPGAVGAVGAVGRGAGDRGDRAGQGVEGHVLSLGDAGGEGDAGGAQSAGVERAGRLGRPVGGDGADREPGGAGKAPGAGEAAQPAAVAADEEDGEGSGEHGTPWTLAEGHGLDPDVPWRELALTWERKLCGAHADGRAREAAHGEETELHAGTARAGGGGAAAGGDRGRAVGRDDRVGGGAFAWAVAEPLPDADASCGGGAGVGAGAEGRRAAGAAGGAGGDGTGAGASEARERAARGPGRVDGPAADDGERTATRPAAAGAPTQAATPGSFGVGR